MTSKEKFLNCLNHKSTKGVTVDFGATPVTGIHVLAVENLRKHYGHEKQPVKVIEPYQMLGKIDADLAEIMGCDVIGIDPNKTLFGFENINWKAFNPKLTRIVH
jgi:hypothetical protein